MRRSNFGLSPGIFSPSADLTPLVGGPLPGGVTIDLAKASHVVTIVDNDADLKLTVTGPAQSAVAGSGANNLAYTVTLTNASPTAATHVDVLASFLEDAGISFSSFTTATGTFSGSDWVVPSLAPKGSTGDTATIIFFLTADHSTAEQGHATTSATIKSADQLLLNTSDDTGSAQGTVIRQSDLSIGVTDAPDPVVPGTQLTYTVTVSNTGPERRAGFLDADEHDRATLVTTDERRVRMNHARHLRHMLLGRSQRGGTIVARDQEGVALPEWQGPAEVGCRQAVEAVEVDDRDLHALLLRPGALRPQPRCDHDDYCHQSVREYRRQAHCPSALESSVRRRSGPAGPSAARCRRSRSARTPTGSRSRSGDEDHVLEPDPRAAPRRSASPARW